MNWAALIDWAAPMHRAASMRLKWQPIAVCPLGLRLRITVVALLTSLAPIAVRADPHAPGDSRAEDAAAAGSGNAQPVAHDEWLRLLRERDALIADLRRRVEALEGQRAQAAGPDPQPQSGAPEHAAQRPPSRRAATATGASVQAKADPTAPRSAAGQFEVDEDAAERALERTLVVTGALLLPAGQIDLQSDFTYSRQEDDAPIVLATQNGQVLASHRVRRDVFTSDLFVRVGLPHEAQLEVGLPYRYARQQEVDTVAFSPRGETRASAAGLGELNLGLAKGLLHEHDGWPDVVARINWDTTLGGGDDEAVRLGNGFNEILGSLTFTKRQDPLVFVGSASYGVTLKKDDMKPGDQFGLSLGVLLAASPETSLRVALNQTFAAKLKIGERAIDGSERVSASLSFGASSIVGHGKFIDVSAGVGLTQDAPAFSVGVSFSARMGSL